MGAKPSEIEESEGDLLRRAVPAGGACAWEWAPQADAFTWWNAAAVHLAGPAGAPRCRDELLDLVPPEHQAGVAQAFADALRTGGLLLHLPLRAPEGRWVLLQGARAAPASGPFQGLAIDCTEPFRRGEDAAALARLHSVLREVNQVLVRTQDSHEAFQQACRIAVELGLVRFAWVGSSSTSW